MVLKNIAVLMTALDSDAQAETLEGIEEYGKAHGYDIAVFLQFTGAFDGDRQNLGEINVAHLPDLNFFDGVFFSNTMHIESNRCIIRKLVEKIDFLLWELKITLMLKSVIGHIKKTL